LTQFEQKVELLTTTDHFSPSKQKILRMASESINDGANRSPTTSPMPGIEYLSSETHQGRKIVIKGSRNHAELVIGEEESSSGGK
jgi:hypothetical protein